MSALIELQKRVAQILRGSPCLRTPVPVVAYRRRLKDSEIEAAAAMKGCLCLLVMQPLPRKATQGADFVFFESVEVRVRVFEKPNGHSFNADAYDLMEDVMKALHWQVIDDLLIHPLSLAARCTEEASDEQTRLLDVIFEAVMPLSTPATSPA